MQFSSTTLWANKEQDFPEKIKKLKDSTNLLWMTEGSDGIFVSNVVAKPEYGRQDVFRSICWGIVQLYTHSDKKKTLGTNMHYVVKVKIWHFLENLCSPAALVFSFIS